MARKSQQRSIRMPKLTMTSQNTTLATEKTASHFQFTSFTLHHMRCIVFSTIKRFDCTLYHFLLIKSFQNGQKTSKFVLVFQTMWIGAKNVFLMHSVVRVPLKSCNTGCNAHCCKCNNVLWLSIKSGDFICYYPKVFSPNMDQILMFDFFKFSQKMIIWEKLHTTLCNGLL